MDNIIWNNWMSYSRTHKEANTHVMIPPMGIHDDNIDFEAFVVKGIGTMLRNAMFYGWHEPLAKACRDFCHICMVDPMLVEAYCGMKFEQFCASVYDDIAGHLAQTVITADGKPFQPKAFL